MLGDIGDEGYIRIENENDMALVATILFRNKYTVQRVRSKKDGKAYKYYLHYEMRDMEIEDGKKD